MRASKFERAAVDGGAASSRTLRGRPPPAARRFSLQAPTGCRGGGRGRGGLGGGVFRALSLAKPPRGGVFDRSAVTRANRLF